MDFMDVTNSRNDPNARLRKGFANEMEWEPDMKWTRSVIKENENNIRVTVAFTTIETD